MEKSEIREKRSSPVEVKRTMRFDSFNLKGIRWIYWTRWKIMNKFQRKEIIINCGVFYFICMYLVNTE